MNDTTHIYRQDFQVSFTYPVAFTEDPLNPNNPTLRDTLCTYENNRRHCVFVVIDDGVSKAWPDLGAMINRYALANGGVMEIVREPIIVPGGEACKNDEKYVRQLLDALAESELDRQSFVLAIGGGAVLDMVGYAAATTHRGVRLIRVPTTVLAQNDAGVGVKNGINAYSSKNYLGTFCPPFAVLNDVCFIETLDPRDRRAGMAEAIKVALIRDEKFFDWMEEHAAALAEFQRKEMAYMIRRCAELHLKHIATSGDPFEYGSARPLDFGHWAAHKLEVLTQHALRHGEAVAIGIALDSSYSVEAGWLSATHFERICRLFFVLGFECAHPLLQEAGPDGRLLIQEGLEEFRQHLGGELTVTMLKDIGHGVEVNEVSDALLIRSVSRLFQWRHAA